MAPRLVYEPRERLQGVGSRETGPNSICHFWNTVLLRSRRRPPPRPRWPRPPGEPTWATGAPSGLVREKVAPQRPARALDVTALAAIRATACTPRTGRQSGRSESGGKARKRGLTDIELCSVLLCTGLRRSLGATWTLRPRAASASCPAPPRALSRRSVRRSPGRRIPCSGSAAGRWEGTPAPPPTRLPRSAAGSRPAW